MKKLFSKSHAISFLLSITGFTAYSQKQQTDSIDLFLKDKMEKLHIPGLQLAIVKNGQIIKRNSYVLASIENSVNVTNESMFLQSQCLTESLNFLYPPLLQAAKRYLQA